MDYKYIFGPVASGRLGRSLGLDLLGDTVCTLNCIYCECGATSKLTMNRRPYVPAESILNELRQWKKDEGLPLDFVTLGGLGEPTLNTDMADIIKGVREILPETPVAVLTNSTSLTDPEVRRDLGMADVVLPSVDSLDPEEFSNINRPHPSLDAREVGRALLEFKKEFNGRIFLEILLVRGVNDSDRNLREIRDYLGQLEPDRVDVATMSRPGTMPGAKAVPPEVLGKWRTELGATTQRVKLRQGDPGSGNGNIESIISSSLARRPQTVLQLAEALGRDPETIRTAIASMLKNELLQTLNQDTSCSDEDEYYAPKGRVQE